MIPTLVEVSSEEAFVERTKVFVCYSHADESYLARLRTHLRPLDREQRVVWDDTKIRAGQAWDEEIRLAIQAARVAVLLVSADLFASDYIDRVELPLLREASRDVLLLPVILSASRFERDASLNWLQAVNSPQKALNMLPPGEQEQVWDKVARAVEAEIGVQSLGSSARIIDAMHIESVITKQPRDPNAAYGVKIESEGRELVGRVGGQVAGRVTRDDLDAQLSKDDLGLVRTLETSMQNAYKRWDELYPRRFDDPAAAKELDEMLAAMKEDLLKILGFLESLGFDLQDHYSRIRFLVQGL